MLHRPHVAAEIDKRIKAKVRALAPKAVDTVAQVMDDKSHKDRLRVARTILERSDLVLSDVENQTNIDVLVQQPSGCACPGLSWSPSR
jgi:hypothetical protein